MSIAEHLLTFDCRGDTLVGVLALPESKPAFAVVILPGGPNYRAGAHRQFVQLARRLATSGIATLRFDYRGMGDSEGSPPGFANVVPDIGAALDAMQQRCPALVRVALCGLCEGASSALVYWHASRDPRVVALALLNPWIRSEATIAKTYLRHYYLQRFASRAFWSKLLRGRIDVAAAARDVGAHASASLAKQAQARAPSFQSTMADGLRAFGGPVFVALSGHDLTAREFADHARRDARWRGLLDRRNVTRADIDAADHTFSSRAASDVLERTLIAWLSGAAADPASSTLAAAVHGSFART